MKKGIIFLLIFVIMIPYFSPLISASESIIIDSVVDSTVYETLRENSITYSCSYDAETKKIGISGIVNHDVMINHHEHTIEVYRILPGETIEDVFSQEMLVPLASTAIAVKFNFSIDVQSTSDRFSRYAIVLRAPTGEILLVEDPCYAGLTSEITPFSVNQSGFKGIQSQDSSVCGNLGAGTTIIPIYMERLLSNVANGYIYPIEQTYRYFDKAYIDELDAQIRTYSASGCHIYLQFLLSATNSDMALAHGSSIGAMYDMPDVYSDEVLPLISAFSSFFSERYDNLQSGMISGIIVGRQIDRRYMNYVGTLTVEEYAERYAFYLTLVANSARAYNPSLDIIIPLSNIDDYSNNSITIAVGNYSPSTLLESVLSILDTRLPNELFCNVMIESSVVPLEITNDALSDPLIPDDIVPHGVLSAENINLFSTYLSSIKYQYRNAPTHFLYMWSVPKSLSGNALACAYTYSYYSLLKEGKLSSFVVSFSNEEGRIHDLQKILRYIDTEESLSVTGNLLSYFDAKTWTDVIEKFSQEKIDQQTVYQQISSNISEKTWKGMFSYMDFSSGNVNDWFSGVCSSNLKSAYGDEGRRALSVIMNTAENSTFSELLCLYEYPENFTYTPYVKFNLSVNDSDETKSSLYEIVITLGNESATFISEYLIRGNELTDLYLNLSGFNVENVAKYIKISVRPVEGGTEPYALWLYDVIGYSEQYTDDELTQRIAIERLRLRELSSDTEQGEDNEDTLLIVFGVLLVITLAGVGIYMVFKRNDTQSADTSIQKKEHNES